MSLVYPWVVCDSYKKIITLNLISLGADHHCKITHVCVSPTRKENSSHFVTFLFPELTNYWHMLVLHKYLLNE